MVSRAPWPVLFVAVAAFGACAPDVEIVSVQRIGDVPNPPPSSGRDVGFSAVLDGQSVWAFGDTLFMEETDDGLHWRSSTWSWTDDLDSSDGVEAFVHAMGDDGLPAQLLAHTDAELAWNVAHEGEDCAAGEPDVDGDDDTAGDDDASDDDDDDDDTGDDDEGCDTGPGDMASVPAGTFTMGSRTSVVGHDDDERTHEVTLTHDFEVGVFEVTQSLFESCMGYNPDEDPHGDRPAVYINWHEAAAFTAAVSVGEGLQPCYSCSGEGDSVNCEPQGDPYECTGYRLPTEAEWEYAARGGLEDASFPNGGTLVEGTESDNSGDLFLTNGLLLDDMAWYWGSSEESTHPVGELDPNDYGLFDMAGNVYEWCHDGYEEELSDATDPIGQGEDKNIRGGSWMSSPAGVRVANRFGDEPDYGSGQKGFRLVRRLP